MDNKLLSNFLIISTLLLINLLVYGYKKREIPGAKYFGFLIVSMAIHTIGYSMELISTSVDEMYFWIRIEYIGSAFYPLLLILFVQEYTGDSKIMNKCIKKLIAVENLFTLIMVNTNSMHNLYYKSLDIDNSYGFNVLAIEKGIWYKIHSVILFLVFLYALVVFVRNYFNSYGVFKKRIGFMVAGFMIPFVTFLVYLLELGPKYIDLCPFAYLLMSAVGVLGFFNYSTLFYIPINHEMILDSMDQAVFVVDNDNFIVSFNEASVEYFRSLEKIKLGQSIDSIIELNGKLLENNSIHNINNRTLKFKIINDIKHNGKIFVISDITISELRKKQLESYANEDSLTGLYNRRFFMEKINKSSEGVFAILDIDHFKHVNDTYGHFKGDTVLNIFGRQLKRNFSEFTVCRYGGEEFAMFTDKKNINQVYECLERFQKSIRSEDFPIDITFSAGISQYSFGKVNSGILEADKKLYEAKNSGRNCVKL